MRLKIYRLRTNEGLAIHFYKPERWLEITLWRVNIVWQIY